MPSSRGAAISNGHALITELLRSNEREAMLCAATLARDVIARLERQLEALRSLVAAADTVRRLDEGQDESQDMLTSHYAYRDRRTTNRPPQGRPEQLGPVSAPAVTALLAALQRGDAGRRRQAQMIADLLAAATSGLADTELWQRLGIAKNTALAGFLGALRKNARTVGIGADLIGRKRLLRADGSVGWRFFLTPQFQEVLQEVLAQTGSPPLTSDSNP